MSPNPVTIAVTVLAEALAVPVGTDMPSDQEHRRTERYVMVSLDGDGSDPFLLRPTIALTCWGASDHDAHGIALSAIDALRDAALDHDLLSAVELDSISREEWSRNGQSRYLALVGLYINTDE